MKKFFEQRWVELFIALLSFCFCCCFFSFVTDDYASFSWSQAAGQFSNYPICEFYWGTLGLGKVFSFLYHHWPAYNWTGMFMVTGPVCGLYLGLRTVKNVILKNSQSIFTIRIVQVLFTLFYSENIIYLGTTRISLLFCGIALINLLFSDKIGKRGIIVNTLIFITGMVLRPESSMGMLLLVSLGYLIYSFDLLRVVKRTFFPAAATAIMFFAYSIDWAHSDLFIKKVEPEVEYKLMEKRVVGISGMKTAVDSVKYQAAAAGLCFDTRTLTADYFRSILLPGADLSFKHAQLRFDHILSLYRYYLFIPCCYFAFLLLCLFQTGRWRWLFKIVTLQAATFIIIYTVDYTGALIAGRHFLNLQLISLLILSFYFFTATRGFWTQNTSLRYGCFLSAVVIGSSFLVLVGTGVYIANYKDKTDDIAEDTVCFENTMQELDNLYTNRIIVLTTDNFHLFDHPFRVKNKVYRNNKYLLFDVWTHFLDPEYLNYLGTECNCDPLDPVAFFNWLSAQNALYIGESWRYDLTSKYMNIVHGQKLKFLPNYEYKRPACINNTNMKAFEFREVVVEQ